MRCFQENYDKWYDRAVRMGSIGIDTIRDKADVLMKKYMVEELQDLRSYDCGAKHGPWSLAMDSGRFAMASMQVS